MVQAPPGVTIEPVAVTTWNWMLFRMIPPPADWTVKLYQLFVVAPAPFCASLGAPRARDVPRGVVPGPFVRPEIRMYNTAARTTVIATSRIVAMIGDTPRLAFFLQRRWLSIRMFIPSFLRGADFAPLRDATCGLWYLKVGQMETTFDDV